MDFPRFVSMLDKQSLFFARADKMPDRYEGVPSTPSIETLRSNRTRRRVQKMMDDVNRITLKNVSTETRQSVLNLRSLMVEAWVKVSGESGVTAAFFSDWNDQFVQSLALEITELRSKVLLNCWYVSEYESVAMWELYAQRSAGIAIQSTSARMKRAFSAYPDHNVNMGLVEYINYSTEKIPIADPLSRYFHKRLSYEHEKELRAIIIMGDDEQPLDGGLYIDIDLTVLIEKVYITPQAKQWFSDLVQSIAKKYDLGCEIVQSDLDRDPLLR